MSQEPIRPGAEGSKSNPATKDMDAELKTTRGALGHAQSDQKSPGSDPV